MTRGIAVFDVNETLLDLRALLPVFEGMFGDPAIGREWFARLLQASMTVSLTGGYRDFGELGRAALDVVAVRHDRSVTGGDHEQLLSTMSSLPPHPDAAPALTLLREAGVRMAALTNSPPEIASAQLTGAGLIGFFEKALSVDSVRRFKPAPEPYRMAAAELDVSIEDMWMVAAHDWDVAGAMAAGCRGLLVLRPGVSPNPAYPPPDIVALDLHDAAEQLINADA